MRTVMGRAHHMLADSLSSQRAFWPSTRPHYGLNTPQNNKLLCMTIEEVSFSKKKKTIEEVRTILYVHIFIFYTCYTLKTKVLFRVKEVVEKVCFR